MGSRLATLDSLAARVIPQLHTKPSQISIANECSQTHPLMRINAKRGKSPTETFHLFDRPLNIYSITMCT